MAEKVTGKDSTFDLSGPETEQRDRQFEWLAEDIPLGPKNVSGGKEHQLSLQFVPETGRSRPSGTSRLLIRSHARRARNIGAARSRAESPQNEFNEVAGVDDGINHRRRKGQTLASHVSTTLNPDIRRDVEAGKFDPFDSLPVASHPKIHSLLSHLDGIVRYSRGLPGPRERWISFAISDSAVLNMMLFISALDIAGLRGKSESRDILYWKGETIRVINKRLGDPNQVAIDGTIAAVASLAHLENLTGTANSARIHANGLHSIIRSRGGLQNLGEHGMPRRIASWSDICTSIILETKPRYGPVYINEGGIAADWGPISPLAMRYKSHIFNLTRSRELSEEMIDIYWKLKTLTRWKEETAFSLSEGEDIENTSFTDIVDYIERQIIPLTQLERLSEPTEVCSIYTLFGYAALIHMYLFIRDCSKDLPFSHLLSSRIRMVLERVNIKKLATQYPEMMLWIFIMGGLSGSPFVERVWFAERVADFCLDRGLRGGDQVATMLEGFLWSELYRSPVTQRFWTQVAMAQGFEGGYEVRRLADRVSLICFNAPPDFDSQI